MTTLPPPADPPDQELPHKTMNADQFRAFALSHGKWEPRTVELMLKKPFFGPWRTGGFVRCARVMCRVLHI